VAVYRHQTVRRDFACRYPLFAANQGWLEHRRWGTAVRPLAYSAGDGVTLFHDLPRDAGRAFFPQTYFARICRQRLRDQALLKSDGKGLVYSTYMGAAIVKWGFPGVAVDSQENAYLTVRLAPPMFAQSPVPRSRRDFSPKVRIEWVTSREIGLLPQNAFREAN